MKTINKIVAGIFLAGATLLSPKANAEDKEIYVRPNDEITTGVVFNDISTALDYYHDDPSTITIHIAPGEYTNKITVQEKRNLIGDNYIIPTTPGEIVGGVRQLDEPTSSTAPTIAEKVFFNSDSRFENLFFTNAVNPEVVGRENVEFVNNYFKDKGLSVGYGHNYIIDGNIFKDDVHAGLTTRYGDNTITNNIFHSCNRGIWSNGDMSCSEGNVFVNNDKNMLIMASMGTFIDGENNYWYDRTGTELMTNLEDILGTILVYSSGSSKGNKTLTEIDVVPFKEEYHPLFPANYTSAKGWEGYE